MDEYLYMQKPQPTNATGVDVKLTAIDPNGNFQDICTAATDLNGNYGLTWTPPVQGVCHITATFAGSNSYWGSEQTTYLAVGAAPSPQPTSTPTQTVAPTTTAPPTQTPVSPSPSIAPQPTSGIPTTTYIAIVAAVVIIAVIAASLVLRRRK